MTTPTYLDDIDLMERLELDTAGDQEGNYYHVERIDPIDQDQDEPELTF